jgi:CRISPR/Cas system CSM-associated protein Csm2 small subunit
MPPLTAKAREKLILRQTTSNRVDLVNTLLTARGHIEDRMMRAARNKNFATVRRIREGIYKDIQAEYVRLQGNLDNWTKRSIKKTSKVFHGIAADDLKLMDDDKKVISFTKFDKKFTEEYFGRIHPFNADRLAAVNVQMNPQLSKMLDTDVRALQNAVVEGFREAQVAGMTSQERWKLIQGKVLDYAENPTTWQFIDKSGRKWNKGNYFNMMNRTVSANVARDSYHDTLTEEGRDLVQIIGGTSDASHDACVEWDGRVVSISGNSSEFPALDEYIADGGFHPNCVHSTVYVSANFEAGRKLIEKQAGEPAPKVKKSRKKQPVKMKNADAP